MKLYAAILSLAVGSAVSAILLAPPDAIPLPPIPQVPQAFLAAAQEPPAVQEPPEYPEGHYCVRGVDADGNTKHPCACRDHDDCSKPDTGQGQGPRENKECKQWCHADHCHCVTHCA